MQHSGKSVGVWCLLTNWPATEFGRCLQEKGKITPRGVLPKIRSCQRSGDPCVRHLWRHRKCWNLSDK